MRKALYCVESTSLMVGPLVPDGGTRQIFFYDREIAIVVAAKSMTVPFGDEIRVVHQVSREVIFRKTAVDGASTSLD